MPGLIKISLLPVNAIIKDNGSEIYTIIQIHEILVLLVVLGDAGLNVDFG